MTRLTCLTSPPGKSYRALSVIHIELMSMRFEDPIIRVGVWPQALTSNPSHKTRRRAEVKALRRFFPPPYPTSKFPTVA